MVESTTLIERGVFWVERIITVTLTCLLIHYHFHFFSYSRESVILYHFASVSACVFFLTNTLFFVCFLIRTSLRRRRRHYPPQQPDEEEIKKKLVRRIHMVERDAFCIERFGMLLLMWKLYLQRRLTQDGFMYISWAACMFLFPCANILYSWSFSFFSHLKEEGYYSSDHHQATADELLDNYITVEESDTIPEVNNRRKKIQELEIQLATAKLKYMKKVERVESKWERKLEKFVERQRIWEEQILDDMVYRVVSAVEESSSAANNYFYYNQALENRGKLEEEINDLRMKLLAANASSLIYLALLHQHLRSST